MIKFYKDNYIIRKTDNAFNIYNKKSGEIFEIDETSKDILVNIENNDYFLEVKNLSKKLDLSEETVKAHIDEFIKGNILNWYDNQNIFALQWHITENCNLRCKHCYQNQHCNHKELSLEELKKIIDNYFDLIRNWDINPLITITGGEPLLRKDFFELTEYIYSKDKRTRLYLLTNGTLLTEDIVKKIKKSNFSGVQISLDGHNSETHDYIRGKGTFTKSLEAIKLLKKNNIRTTVHSVLLKENIKHSGDLLKLCDNLKVDRITFSRLVPTGTGLNEINSVLDPIEFKECLINLLELEKLATHIELAKDRPLWNILNTEWGSECPIAKNHVTILSDGTVLACRRLPIKIGNALEKSLQEIWFESKFLENYKKRKFESCKGCNMEKKCNGGCQGVSFGYTGKLLKYPDPQCWLLRDTLPTPGLCDMQYNNELGYYSLDEDEIFKNELYV